MSERQRAVETLRRWKRDPVAFVREAFKAEPDAWQVDVLRAFAKKQRLAMKAAKGCGKTTVEAWCLLNFLFTRPHANVAATSISGDNLRDGLWKECANWLQRSPVLAAAFDWQKERIVSRTHPATWWASARQWAKSADVQQQADVLAGLHSDYMLFVIDEAGSIPQAVAVTAEAALASGLETKLVIAGNPTSLEGPLYRACVTDRHLWHVVTVTGIGQAVGNRVGDPLGEQWRPVELEQVLFDPCGASSPTRRPSARRRGSAPRSGRRPAAP